MAFNGDDAIGLFKGETLIDLMGTSGSTREIWGECCIEKSCYSY